MKKILLALAILLLLPSSLLARGGHGGYHSGGPYSHRGSSSHYSGYRSSHRNPYAVERDSNGRIHRSESARKEFMKETGYPHGRPGFVIDHIVPLKRGGVDAPSNMQWQTKEAAKAKDRIE